MDIITLIILIIATYLISAIPFGLIITKLAGKGDIRDIGSGNIGATNVLRTGSKKLAFLTLLLDFLKAFIPVTFAFALTVSVDVQDIIQIDAAPVNPEDREISFFTPTRTALLVGFFAIVGHCFPVWLKFKGGKGVATAFGVLFAAVPFPALLTALVWIMSFMAARMSSLAAISAMIAAPAFTYAIYGLNPALINCAISLLIIYRHKDNIARIRKGEESQFRGPKTDDE